MGSVASGNFRTNKKTTIEACLRLDLRQLTWFGAVHPGARRRGLIHWPAGAQRDAAATIEYLVDMTGPTGWLRLAYGVEHLGDEGTPITQVKVCIALTRTAVHFGGAGRLWFVCPQRNEPEPCGKRVRTLYKQLPESLSRKGCGPIIRVDTECDVGVYIFVVLYCGDPPHADPQAALSR